MVRDACTGENDVGSMAATGDNVIGGEAGVAPMCAGDADIVARAGGVASRAGAVRKVVVRVLECVADEAA